MDCCRGQWCDLMPTVHGTCMRQKITPETSHFPRAFRSKGNMRGKKE